MSGSLATTLTDTTALTPAVPAAQPTTPVPQPVAPHQQPRGEPHPAPTEPESYDARKLREAREAAEAEDAGGNQPQAQPTPTPATPPAGPPQPQGQQPPAAPPAGAPNAAVVALRQANRKERDARLVAEGRIAELERQLDARQAEPQPQQQPQQTAQQRREQHRQQVVFEVTQRQAEIVALAKQLDDGEITNEQFWQRANPLQQMILNYYAEDLGAFLNGKIAETAQPVRAPVGLADAQLLAQQKANLETTHPWLNVLTDEEFDFLAKRALEDLQIAGVEVAPGAHGTFLLRQHVARLSDLYGPAWHPEVQQQPTGQGNGAQPPAAPPTGQPSVAPQPGATPRGHVIQLPTSAQQAAAKMELAAQHPPANPGAPATGSEGVTEADIDAMSPRELEEFLRVAPEAVKHRFLYGAGD